jgi:uncharacterized protein with HEPN domain
MDNRDNTVYLKHILDSITRIDEYVKNVEYKDFMKNNLVQAGVIREIEIIGDASKRLTNEFKERYSDIPWKNIAGMRDKLIHDYFGVDLDAVWVTLEKDISIINIKIKAILLEEQGSN